MKKKIILTEDQVKKIVADRINDFNLEDIVNSLSKIDCTGEDLKKIVKRILNRYGYKDISVIFLGKDEKTKNLKYIVHTESPIFTYKTKSKISDLDTPCLSVYDVKVYRQI
jgi:hypothetical protein